MTTIYRKPAECYAGCEDHDCPYTHRDSWHRVGDSRVYDTEADALAADNGAVEKGHAP